MIPTLQVRKPGGCFHPKPITLFQPVPWKPRSSGLPADQALLGAGLVSRAARKVGDSYLSSRSSFIS